MQGFLQFPSIEDVTNEPPDPYSVPTVGRIHAEKFQRMYELLLFNDVNAKEILQTEFEGHSVEEHIEKLDVEGLADFIRHILAANKSHIGWEVVDEMLNKLDKKFTPAWKKPNFNFEHGFNELHSILVKWDELQRFLYLKDELSKHEVIIQMDLDIYDKFCSGNKLWNMTDLLRLHNLCVKIAVDEYLPNESPLETLIIELSGKFKSFANDKIYPLHTRIAMALMFVRYRVYLANDYVRPSEELLDKLWREVEKKDDNFIKSLRYLFGAGYAIIGIKIFNSSNDFVSRRRLLSGLLSNFVNIPKFPLLSWFESVKKRKTHPSVISLLVSGYADLSEIISTHYQEFPKSETRAELHQLNKNIIHDLIEVVNDFLLKTTGLDHTIMKPDEYIQKLIDHPELQDIRRDLLSSWVRIIKSYIFVSDLDLAEKIKLRDLGMAILHHVGNENLMKLFQLDIDFYLNQYGFEEIFVEIEKEIELTSSIILSTTFEYKVIQEISSLMDYLLKQSTKSGIISITDYEIVLYFASEWLQYFQKSPNLYSEALMVISPIISICFVQVARGYFERNLVEKAFLTYLNMHYFVELFIDELKKMTAWSGTDLTKGAKKEDITNKFQQLIKEWHFQDFLNIKYIRNIVSDIELSLNKNPTQQGGSAISGMIEDDLIFGYMDQSQSLEEFIALDVNASHQKDIKSQIHDAALYEVSSDHPFNRMSRMGKILQGTGIQELPFPIIRNIHEIANALSMFPIQYSLADFADSSGLMKSLGEVFGVEDK